MLESNNPVLFIIKLYFEGYSSLQKKDCEHARQSYKEAHFITYRDSLIGSQVILSIIIFATERQSLGPRHVDFLFQHSAIIGCLPGAAIWGLSAKSG